MVYFTKELKKLGIKNYYSKDNFSKELQRIMVPLSKSQENNQMVIQG